MKGLKYPFYLRNKFYDTHIFYQIFIKEELNFTLNEIPKIILDCGANIGLSTLYFKKKFPDSKIYSIEPESSNFELLKVNSSGYKDIKLIQAALWNKNVLLNIIDTGKGSASFITEIESSGNNVIEQTPTITLSKLIELAHNSIIDLLKIDIEGSEFELFSSGIETWIDYIQNIAIELHEDIRPGIGDLVHSELSNEFSNSPNGEYILFKRAINESHKW